MTGSPPPKRFVLVIGTGGTSPAKRRAARMIGTTLADVGLGLVTGNSTGVDKWVAAAFCGERAARNESINGTFLQITLGGMRFLRRGGAPWPGYAAPAECKIRTRTVEDQKREALGRSHAAVMVGGGRGALDIARRFIYSAFSEPLRAVFFSVLSAYVSTYLKEELQAEGLIRNVPPFVRFLAVAGRLNGQVVNAQIIAREAAVAHSTVDTYEELCLVYRHAIDQDRIPPLVAIGALVLDFLCIHPFRDGTGRVSRLLALLTLYHHGYEVGRYISLERLVEQPAIGLFPELR